MRVECALPSPEHIRALAAADLANQFAAMPCPTDDLLKRYCISDQRHDGGIDVLAPQIPFVLQPFRTGKQFRIDRRRADCGADHAHGPADGVKKGRTRVFHQVPAIGDLDGARQRLCSGLAIAPSAVTRDDPDLRTTAKPSLHRCDLAIGKQRHDPPPLQVTDNRSIAVVSSESPIVNAGDDDRISPWAASSAHDPQQGIVAHRQHQPLGEACRWPTAKCQAEMVDDIFQPCRPARAN